jgi:hypothetical protein
MRQTSQPPTATDWPEQVTIVSHSENQDLNCAAAELCVKDVIVQWVPDTQARGRYLSIWIRPLPAQNDQDYWLQPKPQYLGNGQWKTSATFGNPNDPPDTPFRIHALVTDGEYSNNLVELPSSLMAAPPINVVR